MWDYDPIPHREEEKKKSVITLQFGGKEDCGNCLTARVIDTHSHKHMSVEHREGHRANEKPKHSSTLPHTYTQTNVYRYIICRQTGKHRIHI